ncbi:MAG: HaeII family restriction endonuclease [Bacteroidetes bacterium]|nr:HaeII family restriction endonuclease [Bacteroidota bacterium]
MSPKNLTHAKEKLDNLIEIQRVHMYKPIQVAEILYRVRKSDLKIDEVRNQLESYRSQSKNWGDIVTTELLDQVSTSSSRYQDNLFEDNAMPPKDLAVLAEFNKDGVIERYIYQKFREKQRRILQIGKLLHDAKPESFKLSWFLREFINDKGIKRSIDKAFEIVVYALFNTLVKNLKVTIAVSADVKESELLREFEEFARLLIGIDVDNPVINLPARLYRAGSTNAADRGLDIWGNFGPIVQVKHLTLTEELAEDISDGVAADRIVIVCLDSEKETIERVSKQLGHKIQGIIVQSQLETWYDYALHGKFSDRLGTDLLTSLRQEFRNEFPFSETFEPFYKKRGYDKISKSNSPFWMED